MKLLDVSGLFLILGWIFLALQWVFVFTGPFVLWIIAVVLCFSCYGISTILLTIDKKRFDREAQN